VRFATEQYEVPTSGNLQNSFMHLTNYAINKDSDNFVYNEDEANMNVGHKRALSQVFEMLKEQGRDID
jgi:tubulin polyglutamylase TTLL6/13